MLASHPALFLVVLVSAVLAAWFVWKRVFSRGSRPVWEAAAPMVDMEAYDANEREPREDEKEYERQLRAVIPKVDWLVNSWSFYVVNGSFRRYMDGHPGADGLECSIKRSDAAVIKLSITGGLREEESELALEWLGDVPAPTAAFGDEFASSAEVYTDEPQFSDTLVDALRAQRTAIEAAGAHCCVVYTDNVTFELRDEPTGSTVPKLPVLIDIARELLQVSAVATRAMFADPATRQIMQGVEPIAADSPPAPARDAGSSRGPFL